MKTEMMKYQQDKANVHIKPLTRTEGYHCHIHTWGWRNERRRSIHCLHLLMLFRSVVSFIIKDNPSISSKAFWYLSTEVSP